MAPIPLGLGESQDGSFHAASGQESQSVDRQTIGSIDPLRHRDAELVNKINGSGLRLNIFLAARLRAGGERRFLNQIFPSVRFPIENAFHSVPQ